MVSAKVASVSRQAAVVNKRATTSRISSRGVVSCQAQESSREQQVMQRRQVFSLLAGTVGLLAMGEKAEAIPTVSVFHFSFPLPQ